jgi:hypothetical protein
MLVRYAADGWARAVHCSALERMGEGFRLMYLICQS